MVQYRISDPVNFFSTFGKPRGNPPRRFGIVMREVVGDRTVDEVITIGRQEIVLVALTKMQALATKYAWDQHQIRCN